MHTVISTPQIPRQPPSLKARWTPTPLVLTLPPVYPLQILLFYTKRCPAWLTPHAPPHPTIRPPACQINTFPLNSQTTDLHPVAASGA